MCGVVHAHSYIVRGVSVCVMCGFGACTCLCCIGNMNTNTHTYTHTHTHLLKSTDIPPRGVRNLHSLPEIKNKKVTSLVYARYKVTGVLSFQNFRLVTQRRRVRL